MSSTNRGYNRHAIDYYYTPTDAIETFFKHWQPPTNPKNLVWFDPCAGGDIMRPFMLYPNAIKKIFSVDDSKIITNDIREDSLAKYHNDFIKDFSAFGFSRPDIVISNPPFFLAIEFIQKSLEIVSDGGFVVMLLRLNFFGSKSRKKFFDTTPPNFVFVHHSRLSFTEDKKTDSIEYMHAVWQKGNIPNFTNLKVI